MLSSSRAKIHEPLVTGVSPRPTDQRGARKTAKHEWPRWARGVPGDDRRGAQQADRRGGPSDQRGDRHPEDRDADPGQQGPARGEAAVHQNGIRARCAADTAADMRATT